MKKKCFLIFPIGEDESDIRKNSDILMDYLIKPVCEQRGYEIIRSDDDLTINKKDYDILNHLDHDDLAIADLTGHNPNVFYEAGYRFATKLPLIHIAKKGTALPFDVITVNTYFYDYSTPKNTDKFKDTLSRLIDNIISEKSNDLKKKSDNLTNGDDNELNRQFDELSLEARELLRDFYIEYRYRLLKENLKDLQQFKNSSLIVNYVIDLSESDIDRICHELNDKEYMKCDYFEDKMFSCILLQKGIDYGNNYFNEPIEIMRLRSLVKIYNKNKTDESFTLPASLSKSEFDFYEKGGFLDISYDNSKKVIYFFNIKPTKKTLEYINKTKFEYADKIKSEKANKT